VFASIIAEIRLAFMACVRFYDSWIIVVRPSFLPRLIR